MTLYPNLILEALSHVKYPGKEGNIVSLNMVADNIRIDGNSVWFSLLLRPNDPFGKSLVKASEQAILTYISPDVDIKGHVDIIQVKPEPIATKQPLEDVKCKIAISSG